MTFRELVVPSALEVLEIIGVEPVAPESGSTVQVLDLDGNEENSVRFSYDVVEGSIRIIGKSGGRVLIDLFREGAVFIRFRREGDNISIEADFETDSLGGTITLKVTPELQVTDKMLFI
ncbi:hypothetical protein [Amycolatopsis sp. PS_44_ISF1]|uniref:hypothetical protein n=1 Tax=Amycolatopsis sp. PS_44_ISF1 TaxID=2974917 RepID=UPI0028DEC675|nr:hypothetical protein [Amycolatopsis sp. PS_44_ISF1]MDT8910045.1 hypothetical protein [Amycolatopsis sp. PS_44_ISF1]